MTGERSRRLLDTRTTHCRIGEDLAVNVGPVLYVLIIILVVLAIIYLFQRTRR